MPQNDSQFLFEVGSVPQPLYLTRFEGHEALSEPFRFDLVVHCEDGAVDVSSVLGETARLTLNANRDFPRYVHGIVARFEQSEVTKRFTSYRITIVPRVWLLWHRYDARIFQDMTAPAIIKKVLEGAGLSAGHDFRLSLQGKYEAREYCVQYRESDWAFVNRLMEEEGIYFFFEHQEDSHIMVLGDHPSIHPEIEGGEVPFRPLLGALVHHPYVHLFTYAETIRPGKVTLRDYNFKKPSLSLVGQSVGDTFADLEIYDYPGDYEAQAHGNKLAQIRLEERQALRKTAEGEGGVSRLVAGHRFMLSDHGSEALNRTWLITRIEHQGMDPRFIGEAGNAAETSYENRFQSIPADIPFRPPSVTPKPTVKGLQSAIVTGPSGEEIYTDEFGRVKVSFPWDRLGRKDEKSSCWIRVSQLWAGEGWGAIHIPRVGHEVLVDFLEGDPDRPVIVGRVYHGTNVPPGTLPSNKTKSILRSSSTPGGGGFNELAFEDQKGQEAIYLHGQKDYAIEIENDKTQSIGRDEGLRIGRDRTVEVGNDHNESVGRDEAFEVKNDRRKTIGHDEEETIGHDRTIEVGNDHTESIGGSFAITIAQSKTEDVGEDAGETVGKSRSLTVGRDYTVEVSSNMSTKVSSSMREEVALDKTVKVGDKIVIECGSTKVTIDKNGSVKVEGGKVDVVTTGDVKVASSGKVDVSASGSVKIESSGKVEVKGSGPMDLNASGPVKIKGSNVGIN